MTERLKGCVVAFNQDIREDEAEGLLKAILCLKGVQNVTPNLATPDDWMNRERVRSELGQKILAIVYPPKT